MDLPYDSKKLMMRDREKVLERLHNIPRIFEVTEL